MREGDYGVSLVIVWWFRLGGHQVVCMKMRKILDDTGHNLRTLHWI